MLTKVGVRKYGTRKKKAMSVKSRETKYQKVEKALHKYVFGEPIKYFEIMFGMNLFHFVFIQMSPRIHSKVKLGSLPQ